MRCSWAAASAYMESVGLVLKNGFAIAATTVELARHYAAIGTDIANLNIIVLIARWNSQLAIKPL